MFLAYALLSIYWINSYAVTGEYVDPSTHPKNVCKLSYQDRNGKPLALCSATLITERHLMTSGHCSEDLNFESVEVQCNSGEVRKVTKGSIVSKLDFDKDFGVVTVDEPFKNTLVEMKVPNGKDQLAEILQKYECTAYGYGKDNEKKSG